MEAKDDRNIKNLVYAKKIKIQDITKSFNVKAQEKIKWAKAKRDEQKQASKLSNLNIVPEKMDPASEKHFTKQKEKSQANIAKKIHKEEQLRIYKEDMQKCKGAHK